MAVSRALDAGRPVFADAIDAFDRLSNHRNEAESYPETGRSPSLLLI